jgi:WD40 repeat protein
MTVGLFSIGTILLGVITMRRWIAAMTLTAVLASCALQVTRAQGATDTASSTLKGLLAKAREHAMAWKSDAVLVGILANLGLDGALTSATFSYASAGQLDYVTVPVSGALQSITTPYQPSSQQPLPARFRDLGEAFTAARKAGLGKSPAPFDLGSVPAQPGLPPFGPVQASLSMTAAGPAWTIAKVNEGTAYFVGESGPALSQVEWLQQIQIRQKSLKVPADPASISRLLREKFGAIVASAVKVKITKNDDVTEVKISGQVPSDEIRKAVSALVLDRVDGINVWDDQELEVLRRDVFKTHSQSIGAVLFSRDGRILAVASESSDDVKVREVATGRELLALPHKNVGYLSFSPDGTLLVTAAELNDRVVKIWEVATGKLRANLAGLGPVAFSSDGKTLTTTTLGVATFWDLNPLRARQTFGAYAAPRVVLAFRADTTQLSWNQVYTTGVGGREVPIAGQDRSDLQAVAISPDATLLATASENGVVVWDAAGGRRALLPAASYGIQFPAQFKDVFGEGEFVMTAAGGQPRGLGRNRVDLGSLAAFKNDTTGRVAFSPDGKSLAVGRVDGTVKIWDFTKSTEDPPAVEATAPGAAVEPPVGSPAQALAAPPGRAVDPALVGSWLWKLPTPAGTYTPATLTIGATGDGSLTLDVGVTSQQVPITFQAARGHYQMDFSGTNNDDQGSYRLVVADTVILTLKDGSQPTLTRVKATATPATSGQPAQAPAARAVVDPACVGIWELSPPNVLAPSKWVWKIEAGGTYVFRIEGQGDLGGHSGTFQAANGQWTLRATTMDWSDGGTYTFLDRDTLSMTGKLGLGVWKRRAPVAALRSETNPPR